MSTAQPGASAPDGEDVAAGSASPELASTDEGTGFKVKLANFTGPFDLLLQLIGKHKLDVTEVALHTVTDEFIAYIRAMGNDWDLDEVSEFLVIASTLLDLKAARLLPSAAVEDEEDLALLEARDLLFARLLQYKAYKEAAAFLSGLEHTGARRWPRAVTLEAAFAQALPELVLGIGPQRLRDLAIKAMTPKVPPTVGISHVHLERVSVREHAAHLRDVLLRQQIGTFRALCSDCTTTLEIVARFLALLELYREGLVSFDQVQALGELTVRWTGPTDAPVELDIDEYAGSAAEAAAAARIDAATRSASDADARSESDVSQASDAPLEERVALEDVEFRADDTSDANVDLGDVVTGGATEQQARPDDFDLEPVGTDIGNEREDHDFADGADDVDEDEEWATAAEPEYGAGSPAQRYSADADLQGESQ